MKQSAVVAMVRDSDGVVHACIAVTSSPWGNGGQRFHTMCGDWFENIEDQMDEVATCVRCAVAKPPMTWA